MVSLLFDFFKISFEFHFQNSNILPVNSLHCYEGASSSLFGKEVFNEKDCGSGAACTKFYGGMYTCLKNEILPIKLYYSIIIIYP